MSWFGNSLLPCVEDVTRTDTGEVRRPKSTAELSQWLRQAGHKQEADYVAKFPSGLQSILEWVPGLKLSDSSTDDWDS